MKIGDPSVHPTEVLVLKQLLPTQKEELAKVIQKIRKTENAMAGDAPFGQVREVKHDPVHGASCIDF